MLSTNTKQKISDESGMTLIEVVLAVLILGICLFGLLHSLTLSIETFKGSNFPQEAATVIALADAKYPFVIKEDPVEDLYVSPDSSLLEGWTYERICDEDAEEEEDEDGIYLVRMLVKRGAGGLGQETEFYKLIYYEKGTTDAQ